jgi:hypothetical protein
MFPIAHPYTVAGIAAAAPMKWGKHWRGIAGAIQVCMIRTVVIPMNQQ